MRSCRREFGQKAGFRKKRRSSGGGGQAAKGLSEQRRGLRQKE